MQAHTTSAKESGSQTSKPFFASHATSSTPFFSASRTSVARPSVQAKLTVGVPADRFEREADAVADTVVQRMTADPVRAGSVPSVQTACAACEGTRGAVDAQTERSIQALPGGGSPLPGNVRSRLEPQFDADFSGVRVHTDSQAQHLARSVNAHAFTVGQDIVFAPGRYAPHTTDGTRLLAHELTHVLQQRGANATLQRFAVCETGPACPPRASGETTRSQGSPHRIEEFDSPEFGVLISNFAVDDARPKADLHGNLTWTELITHIGLAAAESWEVLGFTDCQGAESRNDALRQQRAAEIAGLLPPATHISVHIVTGAAGTDCVASNASEADRGRNRSVLIRRRPGLKGTVVPAWTGGKVGPVRSPKTPASFCTPFTSLLEATAARLFVEKTYLPYVMKMFGPEVHALWREYLDRAKGSSLAPRVFRTPGHPIVDAFQGDPATTTARDAVFAEIVAALARTPEANIPMSGTSQLSPPIPLTTLLPTSSLIRPLTYKDGHIRIPGNLAGGASGVGVAGSDAGPDLRVFSGSVVLERTRPGSGPESRTARINLQLQVIDAVDFCPGATGGTIGEVFTIPMSRLEATPTALTYDLPFHVFLDLSGTAPVP